MGLLAVFGITNDGLNLAVNLLLLFLVVCWIALVYWTYADAKRRIEDPMLVGCAAAASMFPFLGTIVYLIVRPPEFIEDARERELEIAAAEARLASLEHLACPHCNYEIERSYLRCPSCLHRLKEPCATCGKPLDPALADLPVLRGGGGRADRSAATERAKQPPEARAQAGGPGAAARRQLPQRAARRCCRGAPARAGASAPHPVITH